MCIHTLSISPVVELDNGYNNDYICLESESEVGCGENRGRANVGCFYDKKNNYIDMNYLTRSIARHIGNASVFYF